MRTSLIAILIFAIALAILYWFGPRVSADTTIHFDPDQIGADPAQYLASQEARFDDIREGLQKEIIWAYPASKAKTPLSIVYMHGFSASKGETRPLADIVAREFGANLFYTRLAGHGRDSEAMAEATVNAWVNDLAEAIAIGRAIGEKVVIIAVSTGGGITAWGSINEELMRNVAGLVLISPNFAVRDSKSWLLLLPWGETLARWHIGEERGFEPKNELQMLYWTNHYPVKALLPLAAMTSLVSAISYEKAKVPTMFVFSDADKVVLPSATREAAQRWGSPTKVINVEASDDPSMHVIAGDAVSPSTTGKLANEIVEWIKTVM